MPMPIVSGLTSNRSSILPVDLRKFKENSPSRNCRFGQKVLLLALSIITQFLPLYWILGLLTSRFKLIQSIFVCYPGSQKYLDQLSFQFANNYIRWNPSPLGLFKQGDKWGLIIGVPMSEDDFTNPKNIKALEKLIRKLEKIRYFLGASEVNYAGVLPSYLAQNMGIYNLRNANLKVAKVVADAAEKVKKEQCGGEDIPIILLGGAGNVGSKLQQSLSDRGWDQVYIVDPRSENMGFPSKIIGAKAILIDVARKGVLESYMNLFWKELIIINETYPEPDQSLLALFKSIGMKVYHVGGVEGLVLPKLPLGYSGSVPCCAIHDENSLTLVLKELT